MLRLLLINFDLHLTRRARNGDSDTICALNRISGIGFRKASDSARDWLKQGLRGLCRQFSLPVNKQRTRVQQR